MNDQSISRKLHLDRVAVERLGYDDLSAVRYIHSTSLRLVGQRYTRDDRVDSLLDHIQSPAYTDRLAEAVRSQTLIGARFEGELVGTAAWANRAVRARIDSILVRPMMTGLGVGTLLLEAIEASARNAGYKELAVSGPLESTDFFEQRGFNTHSQGILMLGGILQIPVCFMRKPLRGNSSFLTKADGETNLH